MERAASQRMERAASQRMERAASQRMKRAASQRMKRFKFIGHIYITVTINQMFTQKMPPND